MRYVVARGDSGATLGVLPLFLAPAARAGLYDPAATLGDDLAAAVGASPVLLAGNCSGYRTGFAVARDARRRAPEVVASMLWAADRAADGLGAGSMTLQYMPRAQADVLVRTGLVDAGEVVLQDCDASFELAGGGFDDFVAALPRHRRKSVRRDARVFAGAGLRVERASLSDALPFAARLFVRLKEHHGAVVAEDDARAWLEAQARALDDASVVFAARAPDGDVVAYALTYEWDDVLLVRAVGLDYDRAVPSAAYFHVTYYEPLRYAYERGLRVVHVGISSLRPKVLRGGRIGELYGVFRGRGAARLDRASAAATSARSATRVRADLGPVTAGPVRSFHGDPL